MIEAIIIKDTIQNVCFVSGDLKMKGNSYKLHKGCACLLGFIILVFCSTKTFEINLNWKLKASSILPTLPIDSRVTQRLNNFDHNATRSISKSASMYTVIKFRLIFTMGLEGTGHHLIDSLFSIMKKNSLLSHHFTHQIHAHGGCGPEWIQFSDFTNESFAHFATNNQDFLNAHTNHTLYYQIKSTVTDAYSNVISKLSKSRSQTKDTQSKNFKNFYTEYFYTHAHSNDTRSVLVIPFRSIVSYPFCELKIERHPNIVQLYTLIKKIQSEINSLKNFNSSSQVSENTNYKGYTLQLDLRVIVMYRSFIESITSACRRFADCSKRINFYNQVSLPIMMHQLSFFDRYIMHSSCDITCNDSNFWMNHSDDSSLKRSNILQKKWSFIENKFFEMKLNQHSNEHNNSFCKVLFFNKIDLNDSDLVKRLLHFFGLPLDDEYVESLSLSLKILLERRQTNKLKLNNSVDVWKHFSKRYNDEQTDMIKQLYYSRNESKWENISKDKFFESEQWPMFFMENYQL